jgi:hypothetical protein
MANNEDTGAAAVDVLAAEEFAVPAPDPALHHEALNLPPDLTPDEPHDVLAAEEFAMPSPDEAHPTLSRRQRQNQVALRVALNVIPMLTVWVWRQARRRGRSGSA